MKSWETIGEWSEEEASENWERLQEWIHSEQPFGFFRMVDVKEDSNGS